MKTTFLLLLFPLLLFFVAHADASGETDQQYKLKCTKKPVRVQVGKNVTLNCTSEPPRDLTGKKIKWQLKEKIVLNFRDKKISRHQDEQFKGRVHTISGWNVSKGNLSVIISSVKESDDGVYTCSVVDGPNCTVTLIVKNGAEEDEQTFGAQEGNIQASSDGSNIGIIIGICAVVGGLAGIAVFTLVSEWIYKKVKNIRRERGKRKREQREREQRERERNERGLPQDDQEKIPLLQVGPEPSSNAGE